LLTVFGEFALSRWVYGTREGQKLELIPTDQRLQLPDSELSYLLQEWDQLLGIEHAFGSVRETMTTVLRLRQSVNTLEHTNRRMAESAPPFRAAQPAPDPKAEGELLVVSEDNKGVPMVRPVDAVPVGAHRHKGEKANKKQMACLGCVYTVDPHRRTPEELVATLFRDGNRPKDQPPEAQQKRYWAELSREIDGVAVRGQDLVFQHLRDEIAQRRRPGQVLVNLCDGQRSLERDRAEYLPDDAQTVDILELMHVLPRLWAVAHLFHAEGSDDAERFVRDRLLRVLHGQVAGVLKGFRRMGTQQELAGAKRKRLREICDFLERNRYRMCYDEYLRQGYPIASGVIEGACRHVVRDRMERAGMRWKVPGAQAMLHLRVIHTNGDWAAFQEFRIAQETQHLYPHHKPLKDAAWPMLDMAV
ncbi:MAG TPA: ISKra4 family transposase, partial [Castellaniella sp.]|jgi:hypothetical protein|nr:ISKra4 family transposase [Castellaniella sp.]